MVAKEPESVTLHSLPLYVRLAGRPVILLGDPENGGEAAAAKRRLLERAGATVVGEDATAALAIVAIEEEAAALAAVDRLKARGILVNAVDRPALCDFTLPAIVDRSPVLVAIGTGGASAGLAAALRQRLEALLPDGLGRLADSLFEARTAIREAFPDPVARRRALAAAMAAGGDLDPLGADPDVVFWLAENDGRNEPTRELVRIMLTSPDPEDLTLRQARWLAQADRVYHRDDVPPAILDRARADALRIVSDAPPVTREPGLTIWMEST